MPGLVIFSRRWSLGSDDLVLPALFLVLCNAIWLAVLIAVLIVVDERDWRIPCMITLHEHTVGYIVILAGCIIVEGFIAWVSLRGSILDTAPRSSMQYLLYVRLGILVIEIGWLVMGVVWLRKHYDICPPGIAKDAALGITICNWCVVGSVLITIWCTFDAAGRSWVKMKRYQNSLKDGQSKFRYKRSGNSHRNWRHRYGQENGKAVREYQDSWNRRCRMLFCCLGRSDRHQNSFADIAKLLSEFFRDLDVVPSDVIAGLILLRKVQRLQRQYTINQETNDTYQFLSGAAITPETKFLDITRITVVQEINTLNHYLQYAVGVYGWPIFMMINSATGCCKLCPYIRCSRCCGGGFNLKNCCSKKKKIDHNEPLVIVGDNCCGCNYAAMEKLCQNHNFEVIYVTYHVEIGEPPFFVALDHDKKSVVISVRGTLSLQDVITDLNAEGDLLPTNPPRENWLGHKGMVEAAAYIKKKLSEEEILQQAFYHSPQRGTPSYNLVLVGHSLGAGTAAILAILLREEYPDIVCYSYSPPGGLLSLPAVEYTKEFITSVVLGKDVVPRLGLHQMESLRFDLIDAIKRSKDPKWKIIGGGMICCCSKSPADSDYDEQDISDIIANKEKELTLHPNDESIALTVHQPLYPPGKIIHIVRNHPKNNKEYGKNLKRVIRKNEPVFQALWADNKDFDEILISPVMIQDHMPDKLLEALKKLLINTGPPKPSRKHHQITRDSISHPLLYQLPRTTTPDSPDGTPSHRLNLETNTNGNMGFPNDGEDENGFIRRKNFERPFIFSSFRRNLKIDFVEQFWTGVAPLASPETLSDVSSLSSRSARESWGAIPGSALFSMEPIAQSPASQKSKEESTISAESIPSELECTFDIEMAKWSPVFRKFITSKESQSNENETKKIMTTNTAKETLRTKTSSNLSSPNSVAKEAKRVTFDLEQATEIIDCCSIESFIGSEDSSSEQNEDSDDSSVCALQHCSSDSDLTYSNKESLPPLRRSHEEINLSSLDDGLEIFDKSPIRIKASGSGHPDGQLSPTSQLLFEKLLTIESPSEELPTPEDCDPFESTDKKGSFRFKESNL